MIKNALARAIACISALRGLLAVLGPAAVLFVCAPSALAEPPPARLLIPVTEVEVRADGVEPARGWAVTVTRGVDAFCYVLTPKHVVVRGRNGPTRGDIEVFGAGFPIAITAQVQERYRVDLALLLAERLGACPFSDPAQGSRPTGGSFLWRMNSQGGIDNRRLDQNEPIVPKTSDYAIAETVLAASETRIVEVGWSGASVILNGAHAGMVFEGAVEGDPKRFRFHTACGIQAALERAGPAIALFACNEEAPNTSPSPEPSVEPARDLEPQIASTGIDEGIVQSPLVFAQAVTPSTPAPLRTAAAANLPDFALFKDCEACPDMIVAPAGAFAMGSQNGDRDERPVRTVEFAYRFAVGRFEVTFDAWDACAADGYCKSIPSGAEGDENTDRGWGRGRRPVMGVSWTDIVGEDGGWRGFLAWLNDEAGLTGRADQYRLLSEAEWEYVARAGSTTAFTFGDALDGARANFRSSAFVRRTTSVGSFPANAFGLFDVHGNVYEWVSDCDSPNYLGAPMDGSAWLTGDCDLRIIRGGSWFDGLNLQRVSNRDRVEAWRDSDTWGFRVARTIDPVNDPNAGG